MLPHLLNDRLGEARRGVHREVKGDEIGLTHLIDRELFLGEIDHPTSSPSRRSQAAGDARPKGWRPRS